MLHFYSMLLGRMENALQSGVSYTQTSKFEGDVNRQHQVACSERARPELRSAINEASEPTLIIHAYRHLHVIKTSTQGFWLKDKRL